MKVAKQFTKPPQTTPLPVLSAMLRVSAHCAKCDYIGVYIGSNGGAIFYKEDPLLKTMELYTEIGRLQKLCDELAARV